MNGRNNHNNEVDLLVFFSAIIKRKRIVLGVFFIFVIIAAIFIFLEPKLYIVSEILKLPTVEISNDAALLNEIERGIEAGDYDHNISEELGLSPARNFDFNVTIYEKTNHIKINLIVKEKDLDLGPGVLNSLFLILKSEYEPKVKAEGDRIENEILLLKNEISKIGLAKESINRDIQIKLRDIKDMRKEKDSLPNEIKLFEERKNLLLKELKLAGGTQDIGKLNRQLDSLRMKFEEYLSRLKEIDNEIERVETEIANLKNINLKEHDIKIENILIKIRELEAEKQFISNFIQFQPPASSPYQTKIGKIRRITAAAMGGLALGVVLALFLEFYQKVKTIKG